MNKLCAKIYKECLFMLTGAFLLILLGLAVIIPPLKHNKFYLLNIGLVVIASYFFENNVFKIQNIFTYKTLLLFLVFHICSINISTFIAYGADKNAAQKKAWRIPEKDLHTLEFLGGWIGAFFGQRFFKHKTSKKSFQAMYKLMIVMEIAVVFALLKYFGFI